MHFCLLALIHPTIWISNFEFLFCIFEDGKNLAHFLFLPFWGTQRKRIKNCCQMDWSQCSTYIPQVSHNLENLQVLRSCGREISAQHKSSCFFSSLLKPGRGLRCQVVKSSRNVSCGQNRNLVKHVNMGLELKVRPKRRGFRKGRSKREMGNIYLRK